MKHEVEKTLRVNVPADKIWEVLGDFSSVEQYASTIKSSPIVGDISSGLGARRLNTFYDGTSLIEEITDYHEGQGFKMNLSEYSFPLKYMNSEVGVKVIDAKSCELSMATDFVVKAGPLGWLMGYFMMRPMMKGVFKKQMSCLAYHSVTGKRIDEELPSDDELAKIIL
jgi:Polyketide cyclase / dehydrase and lipid transport